MEEVKGKRILDDDSGECFEELLGIVGQNREKELFLYVAYV